MAESTKAKLATIRIPTDMCDRAKKEFRRVRKEMEARGVEEIDRPALMAYLQHFAYWEEARERIADGGLVVETPRGQVQINPWHSIMKQNSELMKKWVNELGFSPASRKRLGLAKEEPESDDDLYG